MSNTCDSCRRPLQPNAWHLHADQRGRTTAVLCCACHHARALAPILRPRQAMAHTTRPAQGLA